MGMAGGLLGGEQPQFCRRPDLLTEPNLQVCCWEGFFSNHTATAVSRLSVPPFTPFCLDNTWLHLMRRGLLVRPGRLLLRGESAHSDLLVLLKARPTG